VVLIIVLTYEDAWTTNGKIYSTHVSKPLESWKVSRLGLYMFAIHHAERYNRTLPTKCSYSKPLLYTSELRDDAAVSRKYLLQRPIHIPASTLHQVL
jgi:hypothetical protein